MTFFWQKEGVSFALKYPLHLASLPEAGLVIRKVLDTILHNEEILQVEIVAAGISEACDAVLVVGRVLCHL